MRGGTRLFVCLLSLFGSVCCFRSPTPPTHAPGPATPFPPTGVETLRQASKRKSACLGKRTSKFAQLSLSFSTVLLASSASRWLVEDFFFFFLNLDSHAACTLPSTPICVSLGSPFQVRARRRSASRDHTHTHTHRRARARATQLSGRRRDLENGPVRWAAQCPMRNHDAARAHTRTRRRRNVQDPNPGPKRAGIPAVRARSEVRRR